MDGNTFASLEAPETSVHRPSEEHTPHGSLTPDLSVAFRHAGWQHRRRRIYAALQDLDRSDATLARFASCGSGAWVYQSTTGDERFRVSADYCKSRWCVPCARTRAARYADALTDIMRGKRLRFITLTLAADPCGLATRIERINQAFTKLRRTKLWRERVDGGFSVLEVKRGKESGAWHPHIHIVAWGRFLPQHQLSNLWRQITGDSHIVHVKAINDTHTALNYCLKYVTKPMTAEVEGNPDDLRETMEALHGRRLINTFGQARGTQINEIEVSGDWIAIAPLTTIIKQARQGDPRAQHIVEVLSCDTDHDMTPLPTESTPEATAHPP